MIHFQIVLQIQEYKTNEKNKNILPWHWWEEDVFSEAELQHQQFFHEAWESEASPAEPENIYRTYNTSLSNTAVWVES